MFRLRGAWLAAALLAAGCSPSGRWDSSRIDVAASLPSASESTSGFVGSKRCAECHPKFYDRWSTSHHGKAMQVFDAGLAATLKPQDEPVRVGEATYRADITHDPAVVETVDGRETRLPILHAMGGKNVYYFLTALERGKLQVLPVAYDVHSGRWYDTAQSGMRHFEEIRNDVREQAVHWRDREYTFNTSCHGCHVSQVATNYDFTADAYHTTWTEPGINCETCHGPAGEHVATMEGNPSAKPEDARLHRLGVAATVAENNAVCASCHAKGHSLTRAFKPGEAFFDHFGLTTLEHPDYYPDGRDLGENYTMTSWLMSPCARDGKLSCLHCHTSSGRSRFEPERINDACASCHPAIAKDSAAHSHHAVGSAGDRCVACHMPTTRFAAMSRSDHSMLPPTPATTIRDRSPNACNLCHADKDAVWADAKVREWYPGRDYQAPVLERAALVEAARRRDWSKLDEMLAYVVAPGRDEIVANSLVRLLANAPAERARPALATALKDPSPLIRASAVESLGSSLDALIAATLSPMAHDPVRLVRTSVARVLAPLLRNAAPSAERSALEAATAEYEASLTSRLDDPLAHAGLGSLALSRGDVSSAVEEYETALRMDPASYPTLLEAATACNVAGRNDRAVELLRRAVALEPRDSSAPFNLGLLLAELGRFEEAEASLRAALQADPNLAAAAYNLAVMVAKKSPAEAVTLCRRAAAARPDEPRYAYTAAFFLRAQGDATGAVAELERLLDRHPGYGDSYFLLAEVYEGMRRFDAAAAVYRRAAASRELAPELRRAAAVRLGAGGQLAPGADR